MPKTKNAPMNARYLQKLPASIPADQLLVHNHVTPTRRLGSRGFRAWLSPREDRPRLAVCNCGWAPELGRHFRVRRARTARDGGAGGYRSLPRARFFLQCEGTCRRRREITTSTHSEGASHPFPSKLAPSFPWAALYCRPPVGILTRWHPTVTPV